MVVNSNGYCTACSVNSSPVDGPRARRYFRPISSAAVFAYGGLMVSSTLRQLLAEPRVPNAPRRVWRDWMLIGLLVPITLFEVLVRDDIAWRPVTLLLGVVPIGASLWRRTHPLVVVTVVFGLHAASHGVLLFGADHSAMLYVTVWIVVVSYALFRWGSGRECAIGLGVMVLGHVPTEHGVIPNVGDVVGGAVFLVVPAALGVAVRYRTSSRSSEVDQVKLREREQLARELHDTVAHHVSAIILQAQAGQAVAAANPAGALGTLATIEAEASRTLSEMRFMVDALRQGEGPELLPQRGVSDIKWLARSGDERPHVEVRLGDGLDEVNASVGAALYRLAQESVTNAVRHARQATRVEVDVTTDGRIVQLVVSDDGFSVSTPSSAGYGLIGMNERATLLGGTFVAGPRLGGGWTVTAVLPNRAGAR
jgi:two-component sensor histidine kinase